MDKKDDISFSDLVNKSKVAKAYLKSKWLTILAVSLICGALGLAYSMLKKPVYAAETNFVLEDSKSSSLGAYSSLASMAGIDLGSGSGGVFQGDNIIALYQSRNMIEKTLLSPVDFNGKTQLLIERYIQFNKLREKWKNKDNITQISFSGNPDHFTRTQDSLVTDIVNTINKQSLSVGKPDKKLNIIDVLVKSKDELFAKEFANKLVATVNDFYVVTKTKKRYQNVMILQKQSDSVKKVLNTSISGVASAIDASPNANPLLLSLKVPSQRKQVDVQASTAIYSEIVKNLEIEKISLRQETPLIQIIDSPILPLGVEKVGKVSATLIGLLLGCFVTSFLLLSRKFIKYMLKH